MLRKNLHDAFWKAVVCAALLEFHLVLVALYYPDFAENVEGIKRAIPVDFLKSWIDAAASRGFESYVSMQHFAKAINTFGTFAAVFFGCGAVAGEVERGTAEFLVSRPYSRRRILLTKYFVGAAALLIPIWLVTPSAVVLAHYLEEAMQICRSSCNRSTRRSFCWCCTPSHSCSRRGSPTRSGWRSSCWAPPSSSSPYWW
mgnify:CR=1 FL=1